MQTINNIVAKLQAETVSIETKLKFISLNRDILLMQNDLYLTALLETASKKSDREKLEEAILEMLEANQTQVSGELNRGLISYLKGNASPDQGVSPKVLGRRFSLLAKLSPFDFVDLLTVDIVVLLDLHHLIDACRHIAVGQNLIARKKLVLKLRGLIRAAEQEELERYEKLLTLAIHVFSAMSQYFQNIHRLRSQLKQAHKAEDMKGQLSDEVLGWFDAESENSVSEQATKEKVDSAVDMVGELEVLVANFKRGPDPDAFKKLVNAVASLTRDSDVLVYELDEASMLDCLAGTKGIDSPRIFLKTDTVLQHCMDSGTLLLNHKEDSRYVTVIPVLMPQERKAKPMGVVMVKTPYEMTFLDMGILSALLPLISSATVELISIDRQRKLADLSIALDYLQHQFRKPAQTISTILGTLLPLIPQMENGSLRKSLQSIDLLNRYSLLIVDKIRDSVELERKTYSPKLEDTDIVSVVNDAYEMSQSYYFPAPGRGKKMNIKTVPLPSLRIDSHLLRLAIGELIENATVFCASEIVVEVRMEAQAIRIEVKDDGERYPDKERLFFREQFSTRQGGTGKGLLFVRNVAETHGGKADYEYQVGQRVPKVFYIKLPLEQQKKKGQTPDA